jgi:hypothetical protein
MAMRVTASADAAEFIRAHGGQLFVWPAEHQPARLTLAFLKASEDPPPQGSGVFRLCRLCLGACDWVKWPGCERGHASMFM